MEQAILVFDVGKTNKKILIFDENLKIIDSVYKNFDSYEEDGVLFNNTDEIKEWLFKGIKKFAAKYPVKAVSITTHGATWTAVDKNGDDVIPVIDYTTNVPDSFHDDFYRDMGNRITLQKETATPDFGALINPGKGIYFAQKKFPEEMKKTAHILFYPQYFGFLLTGKTGAEATYAGCHSYLLNFSNQKWSSAAEKMGVAALLPDSIKKSWEILGTITPEISEKTGLGTDVIVTMGIHDSNSSLLPYLLQVKEEFILNSTGTWCVPMLPAEKVHFEKDELGKTVFYNLSAFNKPVKTAIFMGGEEFDRYKKIFDNLHNNNDFPDYNHEIYNRVIEEGNYFIQPSVVKGSGQFPDSPPGVWEGARFYPLDEIENGSFPSFFSQRDVCFAVLRLSLVAQSVVAFNRTGFKNGMTIFIEGGFRYNRAYNIMLASYYDKSRLFTTNMEEATAFGAAILAKAALKGTGPEVCKEDFTIEREEILKDELPLLREYINDFLAIMDRKQ
jgi:L-fuculokinase